MQKPLQFSGQYEIADALIDQLYTYEEPTGGFLRITVSAGSEPTAVFSFHDEHGVLLHEVRKVAKYF